MFIYFTKHTHTYAQKHVKIVDLPLMQSTAANATKFESGGRKMRCNNENCDEH